MHAARKKCGARPALGAVAYASLGILIVPVLIAALGRAFARSRTALFFAVAIGIFTIPAAPTIATIVGLMPLLPAADQWQHLGSVVMTCLFSLAVAEGIRSGRVRLSALQKETEELNVELEQRVVELTEQKREVDVLNEELRYQVAARSRELADALVRKDVSVPAAVVEAGALIDERYRVEKLLGRGGMGAVYAVTRVSDGRSLALKVMSAATDGASAARFAREAEIGATVRHPNVVAIHDVGVLASGAPFLAMDLIAGGSLEDARDAHFGDPRWALAVLADVAEGLDTLHARGILHRDLKPANVLLDREGERIVPKIADFGISRIDAGADGAAEPFGATVAASSSSGRELRLTSTGAILGTPLYMAPEALDSTAIDRPADVFSFGSMAYEVVTGAPPFATPPVFASLARAPLAAPPSLEGVLDEETAAVFAACVALDPSARPTITEVRRVLREAALRAAS